MSLVRSIEFDNNRLKVCYSGQLLQGNVNIFVPVVTHIKGRNTFCTYISPLNFH